MWKELHNSSSKDKGSFQFTFPEFVRLVVNGTKKFAGDEYMSQVAQFVFDKEIISLEIPFSVLRVGEGGQDWDPKILL